MTKIFSNSTMSEIEKDELLPLIVTGEIIEICIEGPLRILNEDGTIKFIKTFNQKQRLFVSGSVGIIDVSSGKK